MGGQRRGLEGGAGLVILKVKVDTAVLLSCCTVTSHSSIAVLHQMRGLLSSWPEAPFCPAASPVSLLKAKNSSTEILGNPSISGETSFLLY